MSDASLAAVLAAVRQYRLLEPDQLAFITARQFADGRALTKDVLQRGWLTAYQSNLLLQGRGGELEQGAFLILERLGEGGMGFVFKARQRTMGRLVALKVIRKDFVSDTEIVGRFYREMQVTSKLHHPNIIRAYDAGPLGATHFLAMEFVEGVDLDKLVTQRGPLTPMLACEYIRQAAQGLQAVHEHGLVHRDIKPANLLLAGDQGLIKILDLGLARLQESVHGKSSTRLPDGQSLTTLTLDGPVTQGSIDYLSPEQALDFHRVDIRADIYSLGCTFFFLLTGRPPFGEGPLAMKLMRHQQAEPPDLQRFRSDLPPGILPIMKRMLAKRPEDRYATPAQVAAALSPFGKPAPAALPVGANRVRQLLPALPAVPGRRAMLALALLILLTGLTVIGIWGLSGSSDSGGKSRPALAAMRNAALRDMPDNSWLRVGSFQGKHSSSTEVPWCYDANLRRLVRVGGRQVSHSNEVWTYDLGTGVWTMALGYSGDAAALAARPGGGSERGICYDRDRKCIWEYCGNQLGGGVSGLWRGDGDLGRGKWTRFDKVPGPHHGRVAYDEHAQRVICIGFDVASFGFTFIVDPATGSALEAPGEPGATQRGRVGMAQFPGFLYVPELQGSLLVGGMPTRFKKDGGPELTTWAFDAATRKWRDLAPPAPTPAGRAGMGFSYDRRNGVVLLFGGTRLGPRADVLDDLWVYDPTRNTWSELPSPSSPRNHYKARPARPADCQMLAYDEEHNVHVLVLQTWSGDNAVWAYRFKN